MTVEQLLDQTRTAYQGEVHTLHVALWIATRGREFLDHAVEKVEPRDDHYIEKMTEALRLARLLASSVGIGVERMALDDVLDLLRDACGTVTV